MGEGRLCFGSAGNSESGYTKNCSLCCFLGFVIECAIVCYIECAIVCYIECAIVCYIECAIVCYIS